MEQSITNWIVGYLVNSAWQVPLVLVAALLAQAFLARLHAPAVVHRLWVTALTFAAVLPACSLTGWPEISWRNAPAIAGGGVHVRVAPGTAMAADSIRLSPELMTVLLALYLAAVLYFITRLGWGLGKTMMLCRNAHPPQFSESMEQRWGKLCARMGVTSTEILESSDISSPAVAGRRTVLLPAGFLEDSQPQDLDAGLAHELAHVQRSDFVKNLACTVIALPVSYHPCGWLLRKNVARSRESVCDAMAADALNGRKSYAHSLLRLAMTIPAGFRGSATAAVGIFEGNALEGRVRIMMNQGKELKGMRRVISIAAALLLAAGAATTISATRLTVQATDATAAKTPPLHIPAGKMAERIKSQTMPKYPAKAKADHNTIDGSVVLGVLIDSNGVPTYVHVVKSLRKDYDDSALTAVRQWRWKPVLLNGKPVAVKTDVTITYSIGE